MWTNHSGLLKTISFSINKNKVGLTYLRGLLPKLFMIHYQMLCYYMPSVEQMLQQCHFKKICKRKPEEPGLTVPVLPSITPMQLQVELLRVRPTARHQETPPPWNPHFLSSVPWPRASQLLACQGRHGILMEHWVAYGASKFEPRMFVAFPTNCYVCKTQSFYFAKLWPPRQTFLLCWSPPLQDYLKEDWLSHSKITISTKTAMWSMN